MGTRNIKLTLRVNDIIYNELLYCKKSAEERTNYKYSMNEILNRVIQVAYLDVLEWEANFKKNKGSRKWK